MNKQELEEKLALNPRIGKLREALGAAGVGEAYLVGGTLRDLALGLPEDNRDLDVALPAEGAGVIASVAGSLATDLGASAFELDRDTFAWRLAIRGSDETVDLVGYRADGIENDLRGRDFTANAVAYDLAGSGGVYDPLGGLSDIALKKLNPCGPESLPDDPLRVLRAYRLAATRGFAFGSGLSWQLAMSAALLKKVSAERVRDELFAIMGAGNGATSSTLRQMSSDGVLFELFPFMRGWEGFDQGSYHSHDLLEHSLRCVEGVEAALPDWLDTVHGPQLAEHLGELHEGAITRLALLKLCALMHDIAKPSSLTLEGERRRFIGHDLGGAKMLGKLLSELKVGKKAARAAGRIVGSHMRLYGLAHQREATLRSRLRFIRDLGQETPEELILCLADESATGPGAPALPALGETVDEILTLFWQEEPAEPLLMGRDLIEALGLVEGREIGRLLGAVAQAEAEGKISSREEALEYARHLAGL